jgi:hypothetical protein
VRIVARLPSNQSPARSSSGLALRIQNLARRNDLALLMARAFDRVGVEITTDCNLALEPDHATAKSAGTTIGMVERRGYPHQRWRGSCPARDVPEANAGSSDWLEPFTWLHLQFSPPRAIFESKNVIHIKYEVRSLALGHIKYDEVIYAKIIMD